MGTVGKGGVYAGAEDVGLRTVVLVGEGGGGDGLEGESETAGGEEGGGEG